MANYDILGNIVIVKFPRKTSVKEKKRWAEKFLNEKKHVRTVLEKVDKIKGRLRIPKTKFLTGENTKEALYKENGCIFRLNVDSCYFSPRLASERLEIAKMVKKRERVLVMFGGVAPYAVVIAKFARPSEVVNVELGRECCKYALENTRRNKVENVVKIIQGDVRKKLPKLEGKFDRIVMARPNLKDSFLDVALKKIKKGSMIHYYGFYNIDEVNDLGELIKNEAKKAKKKIKILKIKKAGDIGVRKFRWRVDFIMLN
ncbi:MAG: class I SAM-dependent methyltransferase family protein [Nanoarchaeota archaeon]|nr:class I SAM-dependent methyltransferase family protein [Nanoarchaeota archaeon]